MSKQIIYTKGNTGMELEVMILDKITKNNFDLSDYKVEVDIVNPSGDVIDTVEGYIKNAIEGVVSIIVTDKYTSEVGLYKTYWRIIDSNENINTQEDIFYYVKDSIKKTYSKGELDLDSVKDMILELSGRVDIVNDRLDDLVSNDENISVVLEVVDARQGKASLVDNIQEIKDDMSSMLNKTNQDKIELQENITSNTTKIEECKVNVDKLTLSNEPFTDYTIRCYEDKFDCGDGFEYYDENLYGKPTLRYRNGIVHFSTVLNKIGDIATNGDVISISDEYSFGKGRHATSVCGSKSDWSDTKVGTAMYESSTISIDSDTRKMFKASGISKYYNINFSYAREIPTSISVVNDNIESKLSRINSLNGCKVTLFSDSHFMFSSSKDNREIAYRQIGAINELCNKTNSWFSLSLGDTVDDGYCDKDKVRKRHVITRRLMNENTIFITGNHDTNSFGNGENFQKEITNKEVYTLLNKGKNNLNMISGEIENTFYIDDNKNKIRFICFDTWQPTERKYKIREEAITFITENLSKDYHNVLLSHVPLLPTSMIPVENTGTVENGERVIDIVKAHKDKYNNVIAFISGHMHYETNAIYKDIRFVGIESTYISTPYNVSGISKDYVRTKGEVSEVALHCLNINTKERKVTMVGIGANSDIIFDY